MAYTFHLECKPKHHRFLWCLSMVFFFGNLVQTSLSLQPSETTENTTLHCRSFLLSYIAFFPKQINIRQIPLRRHTKYWTYFFVFPLSETLGSSCPRCLGIPNYNFCLTNSWNCLKLCYLLCFFIMMLYLSFSLSSRANQQMLQVKIYFKGQLTFLFPLWAIGPSSFG